jgi:hypothetical protein
MEQSAVLGFKKKAFTAILDQEEKRLRRVKPLIAALRTEIGGINP